MAHALSLGQRGLGRTWPNPAVGCVIVHGSRIVGRGWTQPGGRPHAEVMALAQAGAHARGATAYVTLEPCAHHGQTGPCAEALITAGVRRVVTAITDTDPRVAGKGHASLRAAGIIVTEGVLASEARSANAGFLKRITQGLPLVTLKLATPLLCEGGATLAASLIRDQLVDTLITFTAGKLIGATGLAAIAALPEPPLKDLPQFTLLEHRQIGPDTMSRWRAL